MLALQKCQPCSALDLKDVWNKMTMHDSIFWEKISANQALPYSCIKESLQQLRGVTALLKTLGAISEMQCDWPVKQNDWSNKKVLFRLLKRWFIVVLQWVIIVNYLQCSSFIKSIDFIICVSTMKHPVK